MTELNVTGLTKRFGGLVAVNDLSFSVNQNEILGLIGPNGSGKSTTLNMISGAFKPSDGVINFRNRELQNLPAHKISRMGISRTFQLVRTLPSMNVVENVMTGAVFGHKRLWGKRAQQAALQALDRVGMSDKRNASISQLTYIDAKRVELARSLVGEPRVLLLDEWLAGLNPTELQIGIELINSLREQGMTVILVEHVMDAIRSLCDRCVVMASGKMIVEGDTNSVLQHSEVIKAYLGDDDA
jgi:ABC-type branched-subunit amino acid transport system ATPase component